MPATRRDFWEAKFERTIARDAEQIEALHRLGWRTEVIWECEARRPEKLSERLCVLLANS